jgi:hypothetical protein
MAAWNVMSLRNCPAGYHWMNALSASSALIDLACQSRYESVLGYLPWDNGTTRQQGMGMSATTRPSISAALARYAYYKHPRQRQHRWIPW